MKIFLVFLLASFAYAYSDPELEQLWESISDLCHPSLEDFQQVENYLLTGQRPYLDPLRWAEKDEGKIARLNRICQFKLLGPNQELPLFEIHHLNESEETNQRCILLFASHNGKEISYEKSARITLAELERIGYSGHVLLRVGGFPNLAQGSLKYCHVPYAFKVAFLQEAKTLGYKEILWLDTSLHPLRDLEAIFHEIQKTGHFLISPGSLETHRSHFPKETLEKLSLSPFLCSQIPHLAATVIGLNMNQEHAVWLLDRWLSETEKVIPNIAFFPEELSLSWVAWQLGCKPQVSFGDLICIGEEIKRMDVFRERPSLQFYVGNL